MHFSKANGVNLKELKLICCCSNNVLKSIATNLLNLKYLMLDTNVHFRQNSLRLLFQNLTNLEELHLECQGITHDECSNDEIDVTIANLQKLKHLTLSEVSKCPEIELEYLAKIPALVNVLYRNCCVQVYCKKKDTFIREF